MPSERRAHPIAVFCLFSAAFSSVFYVLIAKTTGGELGDFVDCLMWCPALAAFATCKVLGRSISSIAWGWGKTRYQVACYLIPLAYSAVSYVIVWTTGLGGFPNQSFVDLIVKAFGFGSLPASVGISLYFLMTATLFVIRDVATVLGEEIGWRGFLVPELAKTHGFTATALISGVIWALWHYPLLLTGKYSSGTPMWFYMSVFTLGVPLLNFVWTWMRLKSGSIWPGVVLHAAHNTFIQRFFDPLTVDNSKTRYVAGEFGISLLLIAVILAAYFWSRRGELPVYSREFAAES